MLKEYDNFGKNVLQIYEGMFESYKNASKQNGVDESKTHHEKAAFLKRLKVARLT